MNDDLTKLWGQAWRDFVVETQKLMAQGMKSEEAASRACLSLASDYEYKTASDRISSASICLLVATFDWNGN